MENTIFNLFESGKINSAIESRNLDYKIKIINVIQNNDNFEVHLIICMVENGTVYCLGMCRYKVVILDYDITLDDFIDWLNSVDTLNFEKLECHVKPSWLIKCASKSAI